ncbi:MAG: hypothetical protein UR21_C0024G0007 [Candidatus Woesebacteria bacterium GW2011_GWC2_31_9]|uniref:Predicted DNA-binding protein ribbon-helix-helix domain-containing protein n=1 Tax=Candidatus Woesebacteria bacterium GW2011_GWC2_31_9 TaxID=1618586 RepID=A0A0F9YGV3_9BACT|nr:MAG: hypothetical protein UR21_C0024G0007 [Candidatus Woesebacteria bacterium GW2011_GWC2_31_9]
MFILLKGEIFMVLSVLEEVESFKNITISVPVDQYKRLQEIARRSTLSISKLAKKGIELVLNEYEYEFKKS